MVRTLVVEGTVPIPSGVTVEIKSRKVTVTGPRGTYSDGIESVQRIVERHHGHHGRLKSENGAVSGAVPPHPFPGLVTGHCVSTY